MTMRRAHRGFGYLALLILVAVLGMAAASTVQVGALLQRRFAEDQLLFVGAEFERAFSSYAAATPPGRSPYPRALDELVRDPRFPGLRRHLRRIYVDPITGREEWGLLVSPDGGIGGVHSLSALQPIKQSGFDGGWERLANRSQYQEWLFGVQAGWMPQPPANGSSP
jgi:type II secretory pathway pseudopilin PulG